jgi:hypothetical protein
MPSLHAFIVGDTNHMTNVYVGGAKPFFGKGPQLLLWGGSQAARVKITISGIPNLINYCEIFTVHIQFTNVAVGCITQTGRPHATGWIPMV